MSKKNLPILGSRISRRGALKGAAAVAAGAALAPRDVLAQDKTPQVPRKTLGKTKKQIPILLFGAAVPLDTKFDPKLAEAMRYGVNYFDTADCYGGGTSETAVGNFLARTKSRDRAWITSKSDEWDAAGLEKTLNTGLQKLQTTWIDLYYLHGLNETAPLNDKALEKKVEQLKAQGKIKHFGFSCHAGNVVELMNLAAERPWIESIMFRYNFRKYGDKELNLAMDKCAKAGIGLIAMKTQGSEASFQDAWKKFEQKGKWNKHQAVLKAVWEDPRITAAVSAMKSFEQLRENIAAAVDKSKLGALEKDALFRYAEATRCYACDGCDHHCNPAVDGDAAIGDAMRGVMYHDVYEMPAKARRTLEALPTGALDLDYSRANAACPNGLDVVAHMKRAKAILEGEPVS